MHVLARPRTFLRAWGDLHLTPDQGSTYQHLLIERRRGVPVAHLTGQREFWSREFCVTPDVLIPRPETELLIERVLQTRADWAGKTILDLATGSGAIAVTLAAELPETTVHASDVSPAALDVARRNAVRHRVERIRFLLSHWFDAFPDGLCFDLIVSNPPYIAESDPHLQQGDVRFEPELALTAGADGLDAYRIIAAKSGDWLVAGGRLLLEHGYEQAGQVADLLSSRGFIDIRAHRDLLGHLRATEAVWPGPRP
jgi:release factor glutamine methyltransferase